MHGLYTYHELTWSVIKILDLYLELFYINGEIDLEFFIENNKYYFIMKHEIKECAFVFEVIDWIRGKEKEQKTLNISLKNQGDLDNFIAFNIYLLSI